MFAHVQTLLRQDRRGTLLVELAMAMPILVAIMLGGFEISRYVLLHQKLDRTVTTVGDLIAQATVLTEADIDNVFEAVQYVFSPFELGDIGVVIVSSIGRSGEDPPHINWQRSGGGTLSTSSYIGVEGGDATLPAGFTIEAGETVIVAEVFYEFSPLMWPNAFAGTALSDVFYHRAFFRPRLAPLDTIE